MAMSSVKLTQIKFDLCIYIPRKTTKEQTFHRAYARLSPAAMVKKAYNPPWGINKV